MAKHSQHYLLFASSVALILATIVIGLGAYTRLADAGLGCPDWPGCYGQLLVPTDQSDINTSIELYQRPLENTKAWIEMVHRYFASSLGLLILIILTLTWKVRKQIHMGLTVPLIMSALVCFQGLLGMWTVTLGLLPVIVMGHLLGGFTLASLLLLWNLRIRMLSTSEAPLKNRPIRSSAFTLKNAVKVCIGLTYLQIALGGWTAANYAATVCTELPICQEGWTDLFSLQEAFTIHKEGFDDFEFAPHLGASAKVSIHAMHRIGAMILTAALVWLSIALWHKTQHPSGRKQVRMLLVVFSFQIILGISNVLFHLPLSVAVTHNLMGLALLLTLIRIHERFPFNLQLQGAHSWTTLSPRSLLGQHPDSPTTLS